MMRKLAITALAAALLGAVPTLVFAQERLGDGALGALAGAVVAGPVGLVVGAGIGYAAGPQISNSFSGHRHRHSRRHVSRGYHGRIR